MKSIGNYFNQFVSRIAFRFRKETHAILRSFSLPSRGKKLLVVKLDAIGDYILFRNALTELKKSKRFGEHKITLLGNSLWKELAENLDNEVIDEFIWIDPKILLNQSEFTSAQLKLLTKLKLRRFTVILHPVHSRMLDIDHFLSSIKAFSLIGSSGDETNYKLGEKSKGDQLYTELIEVPDHSTFEFYRNAHFISKLTGITPDSFRLKIDLNTTLKSNISIIISPGAGHLSRRWPIEKFVDVILQLNSAYRSAFFYICGSGADKELGDRILTLTMKENIQNMCGKLSLMQYADLVNQASLVISNESSSIHLAAALNTSAICVSNGNMFGRFNPYPFELRNNVQTIYSSESFLDPEQFNSNVERTRIRSTDDISKIPAEKVIEAAITFLQQKTKSNLN